MLHEGLYKVLSANIDEIQIQLCDENHAVFKAHFPNNPILPAFIHLEIIQEIFNIKIFSVTKAKFSQKVLPNETLTYIKNKNKIQVKCNNKDVAYFIL